MRDGAKILEVTSQGDDLRNEYFKGSCVFKVSIADGHAEDLWKDDSLSAIISLL